jgi:thiol:disulfide interchange protein
MLLFVRAAWDKSSVIMDSTIWNDARVLKEAPRFVALRVDVTESYAKEKKLPAELDPYLVESVPTTIVMTSDGRMVGRFKAGTAHAADVAKAMQDAK